MPQQSTLVVKDFQHLMRGLKDMDKDTKRKTRAAFRDVGEATRVDAIKMLSPHDPKSAAGFKTRVRQRGIAVEQSLRKTTGKHPEWGSYQMRHALIPSLDRNADKLIADIDRALAQVVASFNNG